MRTGVMYAVATVVYLIFVALLAAVIVFVEDEGGRLLGMSALSSGIMLATLILALVFLRRSNVEKYQEMLEEREKKE